MFSGTEPAGLTGVEELDRIAATASRSRDRAALVLSPTQNGRSRTNAGYACPCCNGMAYLRVVVDGEDQVRKVVREQMRQGCDHVKIMVSGGVASPYDPLESLQFSVPEIEAAVRRSIGPFDS